MSNYYEKGLEEKRFREAAEAAIGLRESIDEMKLATQQIRNAVANDYPDGLMAEIEDIKHRLYRLEVLLNV